MYNTPLIHTNPEKFSEQEQVYLKLRQKEGRVYSDEEVKNLPGISINHPLVFEWKIRKKSSKKLVKYLSSKALPLNILEIGCGNGWLSHRISKISGAKVTGLDINMSELEQAARVFSCQKNLQFVYADIFESFSDKKKFDIIIIASAIQYFSEPEKLIDRLMEITNKDGEIHILDSPIYTSQKKSVQAHKRSIDYFVKQDATGMSQYYFHHSSLVFTKYFFKRMKPSLVDKLFRRFSFPMAYTQK